jgi:hypothetical protein
MTKKIFFLTLLFMAYFCTAQAQESCETNADSLDMMGQPHFLLLNFI